MAISNCGSVGRGKVFVRVVRVHSYARAEKKAVAPVSKAKGAAFGPRRKASPIVLPAQEHGHEFDAIHASPPCQRYSVASKSHNGNANAHPDLVTPTRAALQATGLPWIIENVMGAPLIKPVVLCGTMFAGLRVIRHRQFESNMILTAPEKCGPHPLCYTVDKRKPHHGWLDEMQAFVMVNGGGNCSKKAAADAMGIDWMTKSELNDAIPPAYTEFLGCQLLAAMMLARAA